MIKVALDEKAKNTVSKTLDLGASTKALYPAIMCSRDRKVRVHCDKILERLIAEDVDVDVEINPNQNSNDICIGLYFNTWGGHLSQIEQAKITAERNSDTNFRAVIRGFGGISNYVNLTDTQATNVTIRQMLEALGTTEFTCNITCYVYPMLNCYFNVTGCQNVLVELTWEEYSELVEFNIEITE